jgi:hypothetical protein
MPKIAEVLHNLPAKIQQSRLARLTQSPKFESLSPISRHRLTTEYQDVAPSPEPARGDLVSASASPSRLWRGRIHDIGHKAFKKLTTEKQKEFAQEVAVEVRLMATKAITVRNRLVAKLKDKPAIEQAGVYDEYARRQPRLDGSVKVVVRVTFEKVAKEEQELGLARAKVKSLPPTNLVMKVEAMDKVEKARSDLHQEIDLHKEVQKEAIEKVATTIEEKKLTTELVAMTEDLLGGPKPGAAGSLAETLRYFNELQATYAWVHEVMTHGIDAQIQARDAARELEQSVDASAHQQRIHQDLIRFFVVQDHLAQEHGIQALLEEVKHSHPT